MESQTDRQASTAGVGTAQGAGADSILLTLDGFESPSVTAEQYRAVIAHVANQRDILKVAHHLAAANYRNARTNRRELDRQCKEVYHAYHQAETTVLVLEAYLAALASGPAIT